MARRGPAWWLLGLGGVLALGAFRAWDPAVPGIQVWLVNAVLDQPCPGCGLTRATGYLARGDLASAFALHPLALPLALEAVAGWIAWGVLGGTRLRELVAEHGPSLAVANAVPLVALWLGRAATGTLPF